MKTLAYYLVAFLISWGVGMLLFAYLPSSIAAIGEFIFAMICGFIAYQLKEAA